jgi:hypothetical protein
VEQSTLSLIPAVTGVLAAIGGLFAAIAAFRSAGIAKTAADRAEKVERRALLRDVITSLQNVSTETMRVDDLANNLKRSYGDLFTFAGDRSRSKPKIEEVEKLQGKITVFQQEAMKSLEDQKALRGLSEEQLAELLTKYDGYLQHIKGLKEKFTFELESTEQPNRIYREKAIKGD